MGIQERSVGQEFSRCTGFCLGLNKGGRPHGTEGTKKLAGIKFGVWQLHILLIDGIRGSAYGPFEVDRRHGIPSSGLMVFSFLFPFGLGTLFGCCRLCYCGVFLHWWSEGVFHHRDILCSFLRQSNRSGGRSIASFVGVAVPGGRGGGGV